MRRKKLRTMLGVTALSIGTLSVVLSVGIVSGIVRAASEYIRVTGGLELVRVFETSLIKQTDTPQYWRPLNLEDAERVSYQMGTRGLVAPEVGFPVQPITRAERSVSSYIVGATSTYFSVNRSEVATGRRLADLDELRHNPVIILSPEARAELFATDENPIGKTVETLGAQFEVIGVFKEYDYYTGPVKQGAKFKNRFSIIPLSVAQDIGFGSTNQITGIHVSVNDFNQLPRFREKILSTIVAGRGGLNDVEVETREREAAGWLATEKSAKISAIILAAVAMGIGGISITSLMLTSLAERVKEIGIRRACGASASDIVLQFIIESSWIGILGALVGVALGYLLIPMLGRFIPESLPGKPIFVPSVAFIGAAFSLTVGFLAGLLPAVRAGRLHPLESVRSV